MRSVLSLSLSLSLSLLLASFQLVWAGNVGVDCNKGECEIKQGESKFFETSIYFHNVNVNTFANNGAMTFKNPVYFSANDKDFEIDTMATFSNNGVMNFESNSVFQLLINVNDGILNFNADMGGDTFYTAVNGNIHNSGIINANGQIRFTAAKADEGFNWYRIINYSVALLM